MRLLLPEEIVKAAPSGMVTRSRQSQPPAEVMRYRYSTHGGGHSIRFL